MASAVQTRSNFLDETSGGQLGRIANATTRSQMRLEQEFQGECDDLLFFRLFIVAGEGDELLLFSLSLAPRHDDLKKRKKSQLDEIVT